MRKRIFGVLLTLVAVILLLPTTAFAITENPYFKSWTGSATPPSESGNTEAIPYEYNMDGYTTNDVFGMGSFSGTPTFEAVFTPIDGVTNFGDVEFDPDNKPYIVYKPTTQVAEQTVVFNIKATDNSGSLTGTYTWTITVGAVPNEGSNDATLSSLSYSIDGEENIAVPDFDSDMTDYKIWLSDDTTQGETITLSGTVNDSTASITENITATTDYYSDDATITVTAENGATKTYTVEFEIEDPEVDRWIYFDGTYYGEEVDETTVYVLNNANNKIIFAVCHGYGGEGATYSASYYYGENTNSGTSFDCDYYGTGGYDVAYITDAITSVTIEFYEVGSAYISENEPVDTWDITLNWVEKPTAPTSSLAAGTYEGAQKFTLTTDDSNEDDTKLYYTISKDDVTSEPVEYKEDGIYYITESCTLDVWASYNGVAGEKTSYDYTITEATTTNTDAAIDIELEDTFDDDDTIITGVDNSTPDTFAIIRVNDVDTADESALNEQISEGFTASETFHLYATVNGEIIDNAEFTQEFTIQVPFDLSTSKEYQLIHMKDDDSFVIYTTDSEENPLIIDYGTNELHFTVSGLSPFMLVEKEGIIARNGIVEYSDLQVAVDEAYANDTITILEDCLNQNVTIDKDLTFDDEEFENLRLGGTFYLANDAIVTFESIGLDVLFKEV